MPDKTHIYICIAATCAVAAVGVARGLDPADLCLSLICSIIVFYIFGLAIKRYLKRNVFPASKKDVDGESGDGHNGEDDL